MNKILSSSKLLLSGLLSVFAVAVAPGACAQAGAAEARAPAVAAAPAAVGKAPERMHVIGASVSGGFEDGPLFGAESNGDSVTLQHMLKKWCGGEVRVTTHAPMEMWNLFSAPIKIGRKEVDMALRRQPDVVMAVDFPFWFAYGYIGSGALHEREARLQTGLGYLAEFDVPVIIGDLPDMTGAAQRMLRPQQIPDAESLLQLNASLQKFADEHDNVTVVKLSGIVRQLRVDGVELPLQDGPLATEPGAMLQEDRLHATRLGMAMLTYMLQDTLRGLFPKGHALHDQQWTFEQFVTAAGADGELEMLQEKAAAKK